MLDGGKNVSVMLSSWVVVTEGNSETVCVKEGEGMTVGIEKNVVVSGAREELLEKTNVIVGLLDKNVLNSLTIVVGDAVIVSIIDVSMLSVGVTSMEVEVVSIGVEKNDKDVKDEVKS